MTEDLINKVFSVPSRPFGINGRRRGLVFRAAFLYLCAIFTIAGCSDDTESAGVKTIQETESPTSTTDETIQETESPASTTDVWNADLRVLFYHRATANPADTRTGGSVFDVWLYPDMNASWGADVSFNTVKNWDTAKVAAFSSAWKAGDAERIAWWAANAPNASWWEKAAVETAEIILSAPILVDYPEYINIYIGFFGKDFDGTRGMAKVSDGGLLRDDYKDVGVQNNIKDHANASLHGPTVHLYRNQIGGGWGNTFVLHELIGHAFAGLDDEYKTATLRDPPWRDLDSRYNGAPRYNSVNGHLFPAVWKAGREGLYTSSGGNVWGDAGANPEEASNLQRAYISDFTSGSDPHYYAGLAMGWPDVVEEWPEGKTPMPWADAIFTAAGSKGDDKPKSYKGDAYFYWSPRSNPNAVDAANYSQRVLFPHHPNWATAERPEYQGYYRSNNDQIAGRLTGTVPREINPDKMWPEPWSKGTVTNPVTCLVNNRGFVFGQYGEDCSAWDIEKYEHDTSRGGDGALDWRHWPSWVVWIGRLGYWNNWIRDQGGTIHEGLSSIPYYMDSSCAMRQDGARFCVTCRYRIWVEIDHLVTGAPYEWYYMQHDPVTNTAMTGGFKYKFPSEKGLAAFEKYDLYHYSTLANNPRHTQNPNGLNTSLENILDPKDVPRPAFSPRT